MGITTLLAQNFPKDLVAALFFDTRSTLNRTVFDSGRHCPARARRQHSCKQHFAAYLPTVTVSPTSTRKAGDT